MPRTRAFADAAEVWDKALNSDSGIRVEFQSIGQRTRFRQKLYDCRKRVRKESLKSSPDDLYYDRTPWDDLVAIAEDVGGRFFLRVSRPKLDETVGIIDISEIIGG